MGLNFLCGFRHSVNIRCQCSFIQQSVLLLFLGRTDFAVRFPALVSGILTLIIFYFLVENLARVRQEKKSIPAFFFSFSFNTFSGRFLHGIFSFPEPVLMQLLLYLFYLLGLLCSVIAI